MEAMRTADGVQIGSEPMRVWGRIEWRDNIHEAWEVCRRHHALLGMEVEQMRPVDPESGQPLAEWGMLPTADLYADRAAYEAAEAKRRADLAKAYARARAKRTQRAKRAARLAGVCDRLYQEAQALAQDIEDLELLEHDCQGNAARLREFIAARKKA